MKAVNYSEFRKDLKKYLDEVEENNEMIVLKRKSGKGAVIISIEEYNALLATMHLLSPDRNALRIQESIQQLKRGQVQKIILTS